MIGVPDGISRLARKPRIYINTIAGHSLTILDDAQPVRIPCTRLVLHGQHWMWDVPGSCLPGRV